MRFYLKEKDETAWREVSKEAYIAAERSAGFHPAHIPLDDPRYRTTPATATFSSSRKQIEGRSAV